jgi:hypothetical protein
MSEPTKPNDNALIHIPDRTELRAMIREDASGFRHSMWPAIGAAVGAGIGYWAWEMISKLLH